MQFSRSLMSAWAALFICFVLLACDVNTPATPNIPFAIRIVDENGDAQFRLSGADLVPTFKNGGAVWLKREGAIEGQLVVDAHVGTGMDGTAVVGFTLTPEALDQLAALTRANIGQRLVFVVNDKVVVNTLIAGEAPAARWRCP